MMRLFLLVPLLLLLDGTSAGWEGEIQLDNAGNSSNAYELLAQYGFPAGLLPSNVKSYSLDQNSGKFEVDLSNRCDVNIPDEYPVRYEKKITGVLSYNNVEQLSGVYVKVVFVWWELTAIRMQNPSKVVFEVGLLSASYPASNFDESPDCGKAISIDRKTRLTW